MESPETSLPTQCAAKSTACAVYGINNASVMDLYMAKPTYKMSLVIERVTELNHYVAKNDKTYKTFVFQSITGLWLFFLYFSGLTN